MGDPLRIHSYDGIPIYADETLERGTIFPLDKDRHRITEGSGAAVHAFEMHPDTMADLKAEIERTNADSGKAHRG